MRYKISGAGFIQIDDAGNQSAVFRKEDKPGTMGAGFYAAMIESGIKIEPEFNAEELIDKEIKEEEEALQNQKQTLLNLIKDNEYHLISRRFVADKSKWEIALDNWDEQLEAIELIEIYPKPF